MLVKDTFQVFSGSTTTTDVAKENHDLKQGKEETPKNTRPRKTETD